MDAQAAQPMSGSEVGGLTPSLFWSPDSRFIAFDAAGQVKKIDVRGGAPQKVCDLPTLAVGGAWNRDDVIIVGTPNRGLMRCRLRADQHLLSHSRIRPEERALTSCLPFCLTAGIFFT